uniref:ATP-dependent RNA helicase n=1 Tax=Strongyloides stercoralis TaxID=6248 RepID=A0A0K0ELI4_STRER
MDEGLVQFSDLNLEPNLVDRLKEIGKHHVIGPQQKIIETIINKNDNVILRSGKQTGKSTGYLIPMINEGIKRMNRNDNRRCIGLIITWSSLSVKDIFELANEMCFAFPISLVSGQSRTLKTNIEKKYFIMITKARLLLRHIFDFEEFFDGLKYIVVEEASCFVSIDKNSILVDILKKIRNKSGSDIITILSCIDFKGTQYKLKEQFLEEKTKSISVIGFDSDSCADNKSIYESNNDSVDEFKRESVDEPVNESNIDNNFTVKKHRSYFKKISSMCLIFIYTDVINVNYVFQKYMNPILKRKNKNIIIYVGSEESLDDIRKILDFSKIPFQISNSEMGDENKFDHPFGNVLVCLDGVEDKLTNDLKQKIVVHYHLPSTIEIYNKRIEDQKTSGEYLISIILDNEECLDNFYRRKKFLY